MKSLKITTPKPRICKFSFLRDKSQLSLFSILFFLIFFFFISCKEEEKKYPSDLFLEVIDLFPKKENLFGTSFVDNGNAEALFSFKDNSVTVNYKLNNRSETATGDLERIEATDYSHRDSFMLNAEWKSRDALAGNAAIFSLSNFEQVKRNTILIQIKGSNWKHISTIELSEDNFSKLKQKINEFPKKMGDINKEPDDKKRDNNYTEGPKNPSEQRERIRQMYNAFDNAFTKIAMDDYLNEYYSSSARTKLYERELNSFDKYEYKTHEINKVVFKSERSDQYKSTYYVEFFFDFKRKDGLSDKRLCADYISLDNNNKIVERIEMGKIQ